MTLFPELPPSVRPAVPAQDTNHWFTPLPLWRQLDAVYRFDLDPCGHMASPVSSVMLERGDMVMTGGGIGGDGLAVNWSGRSVWLNPPYSTVDLSAFVEKAFHAWGRAKVIVALLPARKTEQPWWQTYVEPFRDTHASFETRFLRGRLTFGHPEDPHGEHSDQAMFPSVLVYLGPMDPRQARPVSIRSLRLDEGKA